LTQLLAGVSASLKTWSKRGAIAIGPDATAQQGYNITEREEEVKSLQATSNVFKRDIKGTSSTLLTASWIQSCVDDGRLWVEIGHLWRNGHMQNDILDLHGVTAL